MKSTWWRRLIMRLWRRYCLRPEFRDADMICYRLEDRDA